jgi:hypothetical protein
MVFTQTNFIEAAEKLSVWQSSAAFGGQKLRKAETNRAKVRLFFYIKNKREELRSEALTLLLIRIHRA